MTIRKIALILPLFFVLFGQAQTEKKIDHQSILWSRYYNLLTLNEKWSLHSEFDNRIFIIPLTENLFVIRTQVRYKANNAIELGGGVGYFPVATQDPENTTDFMIPEYRGQQDIVWKNTIGKIQLSQRFQVDERFIRNASKTELLPGFSFNWRFRFRIQAEYDLWKKDNRYLKTIVHEEILLNAGKSIVKNTFDQNRVYAALQYGFNKKIAVELGYLNSFQQRASGVDYYNRDIIRLSIFHKLNL
jgi:hypothetical protein